MSIVPNLMTAALKLNYPIPFIASRLKSATATLPRSAARLTVACLIDVAIELSKAFPKRVDVAIELSKAFPKRVMDNH